METIFKTILEKANPEKLYPFLQSLTNDQKKELAPTIKKLQKEYAAFGSISQNNYGYIKGTDNQREMLQSTAFVCFNRNEYEKSPNAEWILTRKQLTRIIDWYCPQWFSDYLNGLAGEEFVSNWLSYEWLMELVDKGHINPSKELVVKLLPQLIFEEGKDHKSIYSPRNILKRAITLKEHIWYLFEQESNLHYADRWVRFEESVAKDNIGWTVLFKQLVAENKMERSRVLKESLLASNRNFNKILSGWFAQLFSAFEPTDEELLHLQRELFSVLGAPNSKPVNTALQAIKKILEKENFDTGGFLDSSPVLLSSETKATVSASLSMLEKMAARNPPLREKIVRLAIQGFVHHDEDLQRKATAVIVKFGDRTNITLRNEINGYYSNMLSSSRKALAGFFDEQVETGIIPGQNISMAVSNGETDKLSLTTIPFPQNTDDLIFLASQAFDNNEPWHFDVLVAALVQFSPHLTDIDIPLFEPAVQRSFDWTKNSQRTGIGQLDHMLSLFFIDFGNHLIQNHPSATQTIKKIFSKQDHEEGSKKSTFLVLPESGSYTAEWQSHNEVPFYQPYKKLLLAAIEKIRNKDPLPLLSTPTHAPCWISPEILINRLAAYNDVNRSPDDMDLQIALSRCLLQYNQEISQLIDLRLEGEFRALLTFLLNEDAGPLGTFHYKAAWMVASLTKKNKKSWPELASFSYYKKPFTHYSGELPWESVDEEYMSSEYDYKLQKRIPVPAKRKILRVKFEPETAPAKGIKKIFSLFTPAVKEDPPMLYDEMTIKLTFLGIEFNDIKRIISLIPNHPEPLLAYIINVSLPYPNIFQESDRKMITAVLQFLYDVWQHPGEMSYVFLGTCMLSSDKTVANIAGETWLKAVSGNHIDQAILGKVIGHHTRIEFAPLKRLTDLMSQHLFRVSPAHDLQLQILIEEILPWLPDEPVKNLKKLLEIYGELRVGNIAREIPAEVQGRLKIWRGNAGLKKSVDKLMA